MPEMWTVQQVAQRTHLSPRTIRNFIEQGKLRARRFGRVWRIDPEEVERFLRDAASTPDPAVKEAL